MGLLRASGDSALRCGSAAAIAFIWQLFPDSAQSGFEFVCLESLRVLFSESRLTH
jgi:hypothetical protein